MKLKQRSAEIMMLASFSMPILLNSPATYAADSQTTTSNNSTACSEITAYFCDDFSEENTHNWDLLPATNNTLVPDGQFDLVTDQANTLLRYTAGSSGGVIALANPEALNNLNTADYYVEAKIRPRANSTTASKQLYLLGRYQDGNNWYAAALNVQNSVSNTQVEIAVMNQGTLTRIIRQKVAITQGTAGELDGQWYQLRLVMKGQTLTVYLDGDLIATTTDDAFTTKGRIGLWTANKSFEIDDIHVGNADEKPASLTLDTDALTYNAAADDEATIIPVTATTSDGKTDIFSAASSNNTVVSVSASADQITLTPHAQGEATIMVTSGSGVTKTIQATISPKFEMPTAVYSFTDQLSPAANSTHVYEDTTFSLAFDNPPTKGTGAIRIYDADNDTLIDKINVDTDTDVIGYQNVRTLNTYSVRIDGNQVHITPHANKLERGKSYYVVVPASALRVQLWREQHLRASAETAAGLSAHEQMDRM
ncbi:hypothetical protein P4S72_13855 [Vibrio sp. PP-XX7]